MGEGIATTSILAEFETAVFKLSGAGLRWIRSCEKRCARSCGTKCGDLLGEFPRMCKPLGFGRTSGRSLDGVESCGLES